MDIALADDKDFFACLVCGADLGLADGATLVKSLEGEIRGICPGCAAGDDL
ncbi:MAG TPA: hypothetical protein VK988_11645 [Acidimicrobiales bacterium]|nr:hypothetical protein [Acidimicrobiales bacterium]